MMDNFPQYPDYLVNCKTSMADCGQMFWKDKLYMRAQMEQGSGFTGSTAISTRVETLVYRVMGVSLDE